MESLSQQDKRIYQETTTFKPIFKKHQESHNPLTAFVLALFEYIKIQKQIKNENLTPAEWVAQKRSEVVCNLPVEDAIYTEEDWQSTVDPLEELTKCATSSPNSILVALRQVSGGGKQPL